jgi:eukaryotic-like serine/threonine-protein kinase
LLTPPPAGAGPWEKAKEYLLKAGEEAGRIAADAEALEYYRRATVTYASALGDHWDPLERARLERSIGEALFRLGRHDEATEHLRQSFAYLGMPYPRSRAGLRLAIMREAWRLSSRRLLRRPVRTPEGVVGPAIVEHHRSYVALGWMDYFEDPERLAYDCFAALNIAEQGGALDGVATGSAAVGMVLAHVPLHGMADRCFTRAFAFGERSGSPVAIGDSHFFFAMHQQFRGHWDVASEHYARAERAYWDGGFLRGWGSGVTMRAWILRIRGRLAEALDEVDPLGREARDASDRELTAWYLHTRGHVLWRMGRPQEAADIFDEVIALYRAIPSTLNLVFALADQAECRRRQERFDEAQDLLDESRRLVSERGFRGFVVWATHVGWAQLQIDLAERSSGTERTRLLHEALTGCKAAAKTGKIAREAMPSALRVRGNYEWLQGHRRRALSAWSRSIAEAESLDAQYDLALTEIDAGRRLDDEDRVQRGSAILTDVCRIPGGEATVPSPLTH